MPEPTTIILFLYGFALGVVLGYGIRAHLRRRAGKRRDAATVEVLLWSIEREREAQERVDRAMASGRRFIIDFEAGLFIDRGPDYDV